MEFLADKMGKIDMTKDKQFAYDELMKIAEFINQFADNYFLLPDDWTVKTSGKTHKEMQEILKLTADDIREYSKILWRDSPTR